ncbi:MAG: zf-HC2 domain-containing protein [Bacteroidales bacterium]|nr:zf-HC2 domain-containing protein [Bacteroidales bacterium]
MNCHTSKKYLYLFREGELSKTEKAALTRHLKDCNTCRMFAEKTQGFEYYLNSLQSFEPQLTNPEKLTEEIMQNIPDNGKKRVIKSTRLFGTLIVRVAASILIIIQVAMYVYQKSFINHSVLSLNNNNQTTRSQNHDRQNLNAECVEQTKTILLDIFGDAGITLRHSTFAFTKNLSPGEIESYAVQICACSSEIEKLRDKEQKKLFLTNLINKEMTLKF